MHNNYIEFDELVNKFQAFINYMLLLTYKYLIDYIRCCINNYINLLIDCKYNNLVSINIKLYVDMKIIKE